MLSIILQTSFELTELIMPIKQIELPLVWNYRKKPNNLVRPCIIHHQAPVRNNEIK